MDMRKLLDLMEATATPTQGVTGQKLAQTSGGQFMNRADRTNQTKVNAALGGAINPATGKPYVAGRADTNLALAKKFSQPAAAAAVPPAATNIPAPSADNEALKGRTIAKAMNPTPVVSKSTTDAPTVSSSTLSPMDREEEIQRQQGLPYAPPASNNTNSNTAQNAPTQTSDQIATAALNAPTPDTRGAAAMASKSAPTQTSDQIATAALNAPTPDVAGTSKNIPAAYGQMAEEEIDEQLKEFEELAEMLRLSGIQLNEKAVSKQQQKFMGMVHAMQKGKKVKGASPELKKAAKGMGKKDAKDFASTKHKGLPNKVSEEQIDPTSPGSTYVHSQRNYTNQDGAEDFSRRTATLKTDLAGNQKVTAMDTSRPMGDETTINTNIPKGVKVNMIPQKVNEGMDIMLDEDGHTLKHIVNRFKHETKNFMNSGFMAENLFDALFDYYLDRGDMPYGIAKAREGDPYQWVEERFYQDMGSDMSEGAVAEQTVDPLSELARLAGLQEDGPGSAMLNAPKKDTDSFADKMKGVGKTIRQTIDRATLPAGMHADYDRIEAEKDARTAKNNSTAPIATPAATKADAFRDALGATSGKVQADDKLKEWGDSPLNKLNQMPQSKGQEPSSGAASSFAPRERERVVSPKIDKYEKDKERAEKTRRDIVDRESPDANTFGRKIGKAVSEPIAAVKSAWHGATDAWDHTMGNDTAPDPKPPSSVIPASKWKGDRDNPALKENDELNRMRKIAGLKECGDMEMSGPPMQKDRLNVTTNMSSDGTKDVTINAQGDKAEELLAMLKLAGMRSYDDHEHAGMTEPEVIMISANNDEEMMDEERETNYANTPEEEYQTVDSILRQGNDLNREKRQYKKEYPGDNPMAESLIDADLDAMLESILLRDDADSQNPIQLTPKSYDPKTGADWSGYNITSPKTGRIGARIEPGKDIEYYAADPLPPDDVTGATIKNHGKDVEWHRGSEVDEGWEDVKTGVSNFVGDLFNTDDSIRRRSGQFRDLETMQQKYKPGTPEYDQLEMRKTKQKERYYGDQGEVVDKTGEPIKVLPPDQWKGGK